MNKRLAFLIAYKKKAVIPPKCKGHHLPKRTKLEVTVKEECMWLLPMVARVKTKPRTNPSL